MKRLHLFEFEDQKWFSDIFRNYLTGIMRYANSLINMQRLTLPLIKEALSHVRDKKIVDLCSGAIGPWDQLYKEVEETFGPVSLTLTDKYPNKEMYKVCSKSNDIDLGKITYIEESIDARNIPKNLQGMRTIFSGLHHFKVEDVKKILKNAVDQNAAIGIFEYTERRWRAILMSLLSPLFVWIVTPFIRPMTFGRFFWTYVIPIIPCIFMWDAVVSCLRAYLTQDLEKLTDELKKEGYIWKVGSCCHTYPGCPVALTYLLGYPEHIEKEVGSSDLKSLQE